MNHLQQYEPPRCCACDEPIASQHPHTGKFYCARSAYPTDRPIGPVERELRAMRGDLEPIAQAWQIRDVVLFADVIAALRAARDRLGPAPHHAADILSDAIEAAASPELGL